MSEAGILRTGGSVVLDGSGYGFIRLAPAGEKWQVLRTNVRVSTHVNEAIVKIYIGQIAVLNQTDGSMSGSSGDTSDSVIYLNDGDAMIIEWSGGDAGATATVVITGWSSVPDRGFRAVH